MVIHRNLNMPKEGLLEKRAAYCLCIRITLVSNVNVCGYRMVTQRYTRQLLMVDLKLAKLYCRMVEMYAPGTGYVQPINESQESLENATEAMASQMHETIGDAESTPIDLSSHKHVIPICLLRWLP